MRAPCINRHIVREIPEPRQRDLLEQIPRQRSGRLRRIIRAELGRLQENAQLLGGIHRVDAFRRNARERLPPSDGRDRPIQNIGGEVGGTAQNGCQRTGRRGPCCGGPRVDIGKARATFRRHKAACAAQCQCRSAFLAGVVIRQDVVICSEFASYLRCAPRRIHPQLAVGGRCQQQILVGGVFGKLIGDTAFPLVEFKHEPLVATQIGGVRYLSDSEFIKIIWIGEIPEQRNRGFLGRKTSPCNAHFGLHQVVLHRKPVLIVGSFIRIRHLSQSALE